LAPFLNCASITDKPNAPVKVPDDVKSWLRWADKMSHTFFTPAGAWKTHKIDFESVPTISETGVVDEATLRVSCSDDWELQHHNYPQKKSLSWNPSECSDATIVVRMQDGKEVKLERKGTFALVDLLADAKQSGKEYRWELDGETTVVFRV